MRLDKCWLLCTILVLSILEPITARKSFGRGGGSHSYPKSGGLSGGGSRYPSNHGMSSGGGHGYPSSGGLSGGGGSHGYPSSGGLSGGGGSHGYPSSGGGLSGGGGNRGYPPSNGMSGGGSHGYPSSNGGLSGSNTHHTNQHGYPSNKGVTGTTNNNVHYHYHYSPPRQVMYTPPHGGPAQHYPVYQGTPPTYVYQYKDSGSKYGTLLAGLALMNLGTLAGTAYLASRTHSTYKTQPGEVCKFGMRKDNGDYEETKIDCQLISSFIYQEEEKAKAAGNNTVVTTTTVTNVTTVNSTAPEFGVPAVNHTGMNVTLNGTVVAMAPNNASSTSTMTVTTTVTNTTVTNAVDVKGAEVKVTDKTQCFIIRQTSTTNMRKAVPCQVLQSYATSSLKKNSAFRNTPAFTVVSVVIAAYLMF